MSVASEREEEASELLQTTKFEQHASGYDVVMFY